VQIIAAWNDGLFMASDYRQPTDGQLILGLTPYTAHHEIPEHVLRIRDNAKIAQAKLDYLTSLREPATDADDLSPGPRCHTPAAAARGRTVHPHP
jgi:hypothetical protein